MLGQLVGHPLATGLVLVVLQVAEGGGPQVKGDGDAVRLHLLPDAQKDVEKAVDGVGVAAVLGGQQLDAVKGPVDDAVAVDANEFHPSLPSPGGRSARGDMRAKTDGISIPQKPPDWLYPAGFFGKIQRVPRGRPAPGQISST